jgi:hypothetical protein
VTKDLAHEHPASIFPTQQLSTSTISNAVANPASIFSPNQVSTASSSSSSSSSSVAQTAGTNASQQLAGNFNTFLQLLTTQTSRV